MDDYRSEELDYDGSFGSVLNRIYLWMMIALAITGVTAFCIANNQNLLLYTLHYYWIFFILELAIVIILTIRLDYLSSVEAGMGLIIYSIVNGASLSGIFIVYDIGTIQTAFFVTAGMFGIMSMYGMFTKKDLSGLGNICYMALLGLIIASIAGFFIRSEGYSLILAYIGVVIFIGLILWDTQKLKRIYRNSDINNIEIYGALILYLDFINLFLRILRIMASSKKK